MQSYVCKLKGEHDVYLSPMHITQRVIAGYHVPDTHADLKDLAPKEREKVRKNMVNDLLINAGKYMYRAMKKCGERGSVLAAHQYG